MNWKKYLPVIREQLLIDTKEWQENVIGKILKLEDEWLKDNLVRYGVPADESAKHRCRVEKHDMAHIWNTTLYIDGKIVSVISINAVTLVATVENIDGFTSKGNI